MGDKSKIEWTDATWNPVTGCTKVSAGCKYCYAERYAKRGIGDWAHTVSVTTINGTKQFPREFKHVQCHDDRLGQPLRWKRPRRIFVASMGDLFHEAVPFEFQCRVFSHMHSAKQHTFQVLTKRPENMREFIARYQAEWLKGFESAWPREYQHVWLGVSVENQATADARIPLLLQTPAAVRWVSVEPMLGPLSFRWLAAWDGSALKPRPQSTEQLDGLRCLDWVVVGGESGPQARAMELAWVRTLRDQCVEAGVPFLMKQWGEWCPTSQMPEETFQAWDVQHGTENGIDRDATWRVGKKAAGRLLDGELWDQYPRVR